VVEYVDDAIAYDIQSHEKKYKDKWMLVKESMKGSCEF
jgi:hypothetical protein